MDLDSDHNYKPPRPPKSGLLQPPRSLYAHETKYRPQTRRYQSLPNQKSPAPSPPRSPVPENNRYYNRFKHRQG